MSAVVVDTNVAITASRVPEDASLCPLACLRAIQRLEADEDTLVLDDRGAILREYIANLQGERTRAGTKFLVWVIRNRENPKICQKVTITPCAPDDRNAPEDYVEFPHVEGLADFDPSDRKFVAVAATHPDRPEILQATDSKWWTRWRQGLEQAGVNVRWLCPNLIAAGSAEDRDPPPAKAARRSRGRK